MRICDDGGGITFGDESVYGRESLVLVALRFSTCNEVLTRECTVSARCR